MRFDSDLYQWIPDDKRARNRQTNDLHALLFRGLYAKGWRTREIAEHYGLKQSTVQLIIMGDIYGGVPCAKEGFLSNWWRYSINALEQDWLEYKRRHAPPEPVQLTELQIAKRRFNEVKKWLRTSNT